jgi:hypothetical protein
MRLRASLLLLGALIFAAGTMPAQCRGRYHALIGWSVTISSWREVVDSLLQGMTGSGAKRSSIVAHANRDHKKSDSSSLAKPK